MNKKALFAIVLLLIFAGGGYFFMSPSGNKATVRPGVKEPKFRQDGTLTFAKASDSAFSKTIAIEVADEEWEITQGLMYRTKMDANAGMLFIFDDVRPRSFWMRNTIISLDILFIGPDNRIVTIQKYTTPYSEESVPSYKPAQYVLEVNAGFCDKHELGEGDLVDFKL